MGPMVPMGLRGEKLRALLVKWYDLNDTYERGTPEKQKYAGGGRLHVGGDQKGTGVL